MTLPVTVPKDLHDAMAEELGKDFAVSYLCGAIVFNGVLRPRTAIARERIMQSFAARKVLKDQNVVMGQVIPLEERRAIDDVEDWRRDNPNYNWLKGRSNR